ncbi:MAG: hypothetical protein IPJ39_22215 [Saprospiraceae bacterium]|nr:hypothetical protein [Saprospiraceae bacterium]
MNLLFPHYTRWFLLLYFLFLDDNAYLSGIIFRDLSCLILWTRLIELQGEFIFKYQNFRKSHIEKMKSTYKDKAGKVMSVNIKHQQMNSYTRSQGQSVFFIQK